MAYYPWSVPDEIIYFIYEQFQRFNAEPPTEKVLDVVADHILIFVSEWNYYPVSPQEAAIRYERPGLTEVEKTKFLGFLEYKTKVILHLNPTIDQLHLATWAALLFCWSQPGETHVDWYKRMETIHPPEDIAL